MTEESGFFDLDGHGVADFADETYHDFREIYRSQSTFCRILTAKKKGRIFVFKCLREEYHDNPVALVALRKEYDCGYSVDSPYVVHTLDFVDLPEFGPAIKFEYCPGETLGSLIERGDTLSATDIDKIVTGITGALADLHALGILHRDIKPSNILYSPSTGKLSVIDLGCADSENFTILHNPAGTPHFTPADVAEAKKPADSSSDFYAAGATLARLGAIAPPSRRKALCALAAKMTAQSISSRDAALEFYNKECGKKGRWKKLLIALIAAVLATLAILPAIFFSDINSQSEKADSEKPAVTHDSATHLSPTSASGVAPESQQHDNHPSPVSSPNQEEQRQGKGSEAKPDVSSEIDQIPYATPEEKVKNEYGVSQAEAKYTALFNKNEIDRYTINRTDNLLQECVKTSADFKLPQAQREEARKHYHSFEYISEKVTKEVAQKYPEANRHRVLGLIKQRMQLWQSSYK